MAPKPPSLLTRAVALDRRPLAALLTRLGLTALAFRLWDLRYLPSPLAMEDVEPELLALAKARGFDLLDPAQWPGVRGLFLHIAAIVLGLSLLWWGLSFARRRIHRRFGFSFTTLGLLVLSGAILWVGTRLILNTLPPGSWIDGPMSHRTWDAVAVWGGWVKGSILNGATWAPFQRWMPWLTLVTLTEGCLVVLHTRMALWEAQDGALRARLAPHFLFNALSTLTAQIEMAPQRAVLTAQRLTGLFRRVLTLSEQPTVALGEELALVEDQLALERERLGERLQVEVDIPESLLEARVPVLGLQILVENAVRHGVEPRPEGGALRIRGTREGRNLLLEVIDPGDGRHTTPGGTGKALENLRARLARPSDLQLAAVPGGFRATLCVPQSR